MSAILPSNGAVAPVDRLEPAPSARVPRTPPPTVLPDPASPDPVAPQPPRRLRATQRSDASPGRRLWLRFRQNRLGFASLIVFALLFVVSLAAELVSNDKPLVVRYQGQWYFPLVKTYPEPVFGGTLPIETDYRDPFFRAQFDQPGNFALYAPNPHGYATINYHSQALNFPAPPSAENWLGTDISGRDVAARLLYGFRSSVTFGLGLAIVGTLIGIVMGAVQGYFAGRTDLVLQRLIEIWGSMPELYLLIIFASLFEPSLFLLFVLLSLFGWIGLSDYVRAEFLRNRQLEFVQAARVMGLRPSQIIWRHVLPNSLTPVITFLPFRVSAAVLALTSLDFLGLGVRPPAPSLGELLSQGKAHLYAWWISIPTFLVLVALLLLLTFVGDALRDALDSRVADRRPKGTT